jgi:hypothetical protein
MYEGLHAGRKSHGFEIDHKQMDVLQHSLRSLNVAKHKDWSEYGTSEHRDYNTRLQTAQRISIHSSSASIHRRSQSTTYSQPSHSEPQKSSHFRLSDSGSPRYHRPAQLKTKAKMVEHAKMDSKSLIAAALAPVPGFPVPEQTSDDGSRDSKTPVNTDTPKQKVSLNMVVRHSAIQLRIKAAHQLTMITEASNKWISQTTPTYIKCLFTFF